LTVSRSRWEEEELWREIEKKAKEGKAKEATELSVKQKGAMAVQLEKEAEVL
jgi:hypothetical protein